MPTTSSDSGGITNLVLLQHIQGMRTDLETRMDRIEKRITGVERNINGIETTMREGFTETKRRFDSIDAALQRLYVHRVSMLGRIERLEEVVGIAQ